MFTPTDVHRIVGSLYLSTRSTDVQVTLGAKVLDAATRRERDVDIVLAQSGSTAVLGVEVKAEKHPLDTPLVEGLCLKLNDMPSIRTRQIVSAAGFTAPAIRKAEAHGVECLRLVRGKLPAFDPVDLSGLRVWHYAGRAWAPDHRTQLILEDDVPSSVKDSLNQDLGSSSLVIVSEGEALAVRQFRNRCLDSLLNRLDLPNDSGHHPISLRLDLDFEASLLIRDRSIKILALQVDATAIVESAVLPIENSFYLERPDGHALAATAIVEVPQGLIGVAVSPGSSGIGFFTIPEQLRNIRPTREVMTLHIPPAVKSE